MKNLKENPSLKTQIAERESMIQLHTQREPEGQPLQEYLLFGRYSLKNEDGLLTEEKRINFRKSMIH
mgnify:CR=1 FL=1